MVSHGLLDSSHVVASLRHIKLLFLSGSAFLCLASSTSLSDWSNELLSPLVMHAGGVVCLHLNSELVKHNHTDLIAKHCLFLLFFAAESLILSLFLVFE